MRAISAAGGCAGLIAVFVCCTAWFVTITRFSFILTSSDLICLFLGIGTGVIYFVRLVRVVNSVI